jgi:trans-2,3-dihydro-3-hydroxyanthranilate isomerase
VEHRYYLSDVFTDRAFGGNPLAVFPDGERVPEALMPRIARELNLSETVFVLPPTSPVNRCRLRIFTPARELPFAGHPTVGTACTLAEIGRLAPMRESGGSGVVTESTHVIFEEGAGPVSVSVERKGPEYRATFVAPRVPEPGPPPPPVAALAECLSVSPGEIVTDRLVPSTATCGVPFLFVPLRDRGALARVRVDSAAWQAHLAGFWTSEVFAFTEDAELPGSSVRARMFAPLFGIQEDPATGSAAAALAGVLAPRPAPNEGETVRWRIEQGFEMGRPSLIDLEAELGPGGIRLVRVGGQSVLIGEGTLDV